MRLRSFGNLGDLVRPLFDLGERLFRVRRHDTDEVLAHCENLKQTAAVQDEAFRRTLRTARSAAHVQFHVADAATILRLDPIALLYVATVLAQRLDSANR